MKKELLIINEMASISKVEQFVEEIGEELSLSMSIVNNINLALEEAVANVIMYAYPTEKNEIHLFAQYKEGELIFMLTDKGTPFNPTEVEEPDLTLSAEERPVGGLGILLIRKIMNEVTYERIGGENRLILKKTIDKQ